MLPSLPGAGQPRLPPVLQDTPFHPLDFCGAAVEGAGLTHSGMGQRLALLGKKPPKGHLKSTGNADHFSALTADRVRIRRCLKAWRQTLRGESNGPSSCLIPLLLRIVKGADFRGFSKTKTSPWPAARSCFG